MQHDVPFFGPSVQRPFSEADEQLVFEEVPDELDVPDVPDVPPELVPPELVPPELVPPELVPPELEPLSSDDEHAATETATRRTDESEVMRAMFMTPRTRPLVRSRTEIVLRVRFRDQAEITAVQAPGRG